MASFTRDPGGVMSTTRSRGEIWFEALAGQSSQPAPVLSGNAELGGESAQFIAVVPDAQQRFPRAADNVVGLEQGWLLARTVRATMAADARAAIRRPIIALVDVKSQAYGRREEMLRT